MTAKDIQQGSFRMIHSVSVKSKFPPLAESHPTSSFSVSAKAILSDDCGRVTNDFVSL